MVSRPEDAWTQQRKSVVHMNYVRREPCDAVSQPSVAGLGPEKPGNRQHLADCGCLLQGRIRGLKLLPVTPLPQELSFEVHDGFFSTPAGCVAIMHLQDAKISIKGKHVGLRRTQPLIVPQLGNRRPAR